MEHLYDFYVGICYLQLNKMETGEYYFNKTLADEKKYKSDATWIHYLHWYYLGIVKFEKKDFKNAILCFDESIKLYPQFSDAKYYKARCLFMDKKLEDAKEVFKDANNGFTFNEDNSIYELYPYQVNKH